MGIVATFGPTTGWVGKTISYDDGRFALDGYGRITARDVLEYDRQGQITWAYEGLRDWVGSLAAIEGGTAVVSHAELLNETVRDTVPAESDDGEAASQADASPLIAAGMSVSSVPTSTEPPEPASLTMPDSKARKAMRVLSSLLVGLATLLSVVIVGDPARSSHRDVVWYESVAALAVLVAMLVLVGRLRMKPRRSLLWLKVSTSTLLVLAGFAVAAGAGLLSRWLAVPWYGAQDLAALVTYWTLAAEAAAITVVIHDREPLASSGNPNAIAWRIRWPKWMGVPCVILLLLSGQFPGALVLSGTLAAYLLVWSGRRRMTAEGTRLRWPGRGWPAAAGIAGVVVAAIVLLGGPGQFNSLERKFENASTTAQGPSSLGVAATTGKTVQYANTQYGFSLSYSSRAFAPVTDQAVLQQLKSQLAGAFIYALASSDKQSLLVIAAVHKPTTKPQRQASRAQYDRLARVLKGLYVKSMPDAKNVFAKRIRLGDLNGLYVRYERQGQFHTDAHLWGRGVVFDVMTSYPVLGAAASHENLREVLKSFYAGKTTTFEEWLAQHTTDAAGNPSVAP